MSWLFLHNNAVSTKGNEKPYTLRNSEGDAALLATGSIVIEIDLSIVSKVPCRLVNYENSNEWLRRFIIYLNADFSLSVELTQGCAKSYVRLPNIQPQTPGIRRLTYSWDAPRKNGVLSLENHDGSSIYQTVFQNPVPLPICDAQKIALGSEDTSIDVGVLNIAVSDQIVPVGPRPTICAGALIETSDGYRPVEFLRLGDLVITHDHGLQPVRWVMKQMLPTSGGSAPIKLHAPYFDLFENITVAQNQRVMISGIETEYNLGKDAALIEARNLVGYPGATLQSDRPTTTYYQLLFDQHECIRLSGTWADSLYVGRLAESSNMIETTSLAKIPTSILPIHNELVHPVLRKYETRALLEALTA